MMFPYVFMIGSVDGIFFVSRSACMLQVIGPRCVSKSARIIDEDYTISLSLEEAVPS